MYVNWKTVTSIAIKAYVKIVLHIAKIVHV